MPEKDLLEINKKIYLKNATIKQKIAYVWEYYKLHIFIIACVIIGASYFIYHLVTRTEACLSGIFLNAYNMENDSDVEDLGNEFLKLQNIDSSKYEVRFNDGLYLTGDDKLDFETDQAVWIQCTSGTVDFMVSPMEFLMDSAYQQYYVDLTSVLTEEQINKYQPYFLYIDGATVEEVTELSNELKDISSELPDPAKPEEMIDPIPVFIDMTQCEKLANIYKDTESLVFGALVNAPDIDLAIEFLDYLTE